MPYDPVARHHAIEKQVVKGKDKKYYRFRIDRWYGGIATADCCGCGLYCKFCWTSNAALEKPHKMGDFYDARTVAERLIFLSRKKNITQLRISGGEPTIGMEHLLLVLDNLKDKNCRFILETNGILIGNEKSYAQHLAAYPFLHVRLSLKGCSEKEFAMLTNAQPNGFAMQIKALENLVEAKVSCHASVMSSFSSKESFDSLAARISEITREELEIEELILYPNVVKRLKRFGLNYNIAHSPNRVPPELV